MRGSNLRRQGNGAGESISLGMVLSESIEERQHTIFNVVICNKKLPKQVMLNTCCFYGGHSNKGKEK